ncbi:hypothetical protein D7B24_003744 [Verticillium nonalfalfae]|uniref:Hsp90-like protein n=1 Tax=Verticillium nonalfalfae TaxID=1051616 RepID=A0A3M9XWU7_9PEZI|nr:uncharacterized protein D7B24_003744 [Verticillium nonalfalfae]RNJ52365.1 hypothetical protein D7B24_003744 [Verticillium nonalfalfae]
MDPPRQALWPIGLLEPDPRPSFLVQLPASSDAVTDATVVYQNPALASHGDLQSTVALLPVQRGEPFWSWIINPEVDGAGSPSFSFRGSIWTKIVLQIRWIIVGSNEIHPPETSAVLGVPSISRVQSSQMRLDGLDHLNRSMTKSQFTESAPTMPITNPHLEPDKPRPARVPSEPNQKATEIAHGQESFLEIVEATDWNSTPLGPMDSWPPLLQQTYSQMLCNSQPTAIYWGEDFTTVYNEAFSLLVGSRHPSTLGKPMQDVFPDMAGQIQKLMDTSVKKQRASNEDETRFFVDTPSRPPLETYLKWSIVPLTQDNKCYGFVHHISETTLYQLFRRRIKMLVNMGEELGTAKDVKSLWGKLINEFASYEPAYDIPLAILYSIEKDESVHEGTTTKYASSRICHFEGALGVPPGHPITPEQLRLSEADDGLAPQIRRALRGRKPLLISEADGSLPKHLLQGLQWRGFGDPCDLAIVLPIRPTRDEEEMGVLILGLNPRRPYDDAYKLYIRLLNQKLSMSLACTVLLQEERRRGRTAAEQAAYDHAMLKEKLAYQMKETIEYTRLFQTVSEFIPNGFSIGDHQGNITFANRLWYRITGYPEGPVSNAGFLACVLEEDRPKIREAYERLKSRDEVDFEFRIREADHKEEPMRVQSPFENAGLDLAAAAQDRTERHVMAQAKAERAGDGTIIRTFTCLTDVTAHKKVADEAIMRAQQAGNLKRMAELATVGMFDMDMSGRLLGANNVFFELCGLAKVNPLKVVVRPWSTCVVEEDLPILSESLARLSRDAKPQVAEIRLKTTWIAQDVAGNSITAPRWVNATFMPVRDSDGVVQSFTGCLSDVSLPKWQLELETERKEEAIDSKRQQDNFIDMTSHEMRNPLSAIIHCSDAIIASLAKGQELLEHGPRSPRSPRSASSATDSHGDGQVDLSQLITDSIDNAETIVACAQHQKRIVDDILTMSKLDSKLLAVTPCTVNPVLIGQEALRMFDVEARRVDIDLTMTVDQSYKGLGYEYLDLDPSRVKQVLINLLTNALKFTKSGSTRNVSVSMKGSRERPTNETSPVTFIPRSCEEDSEYEQPALEGRDNPVYLIFEVKDTGQGLSAAEKANLFNRFVQASSRTHVKYGGSGLGLFISRRLTELQRGAIGVSSLPGVGSTFAFYIEAYVPTEEARQEAEFATDAARTSPLIFGTPSPGQSAAGHRVTKARTPSVTQRPKRQVGNPRDRRLDGILVVEDNLINQQITRRGLHDRGFRVDVANHGLEALEKLAESVAQRRVQERREEAGDGDVAVKTTTTAEAGSVPLVINLILMDIEMPIQDGLTCTRHIRAMEKEGKLFCGDDGGRIPIIAVSANARPEQMQQAREAGCDDVLVKPYRMPELIEKMHVVVRRVRALSSAAAVRQG